MQAIDFINNCGQDVLESIPQDFLANAGEDWFYIPAELLTTGKVRLMLEAISTEDDGSVSFKVRFAAKMDHSSNLVALRPGAKDGEWLVGFRSGKLRLSADVAAQLFSSKELAALEAHAELWQDDSIDMFSPEYVKRRLYLTASAADAAFRYMLVERQHPTDGYHVAGITQPCWKGMKLIGTGLSSAEEVRVENFTVKVSASVAEVARKRLAA